METITILEFFQTIKIPATVLHVIAVVFGMGAGLVSDVLFSFFSKDKKLDKKEIATLSVLAKIVFYSLIIITISGVAIFLSDIEKYTHSTKFLSKMTVLAILLLNGYVLNNYIWAHLLNKKFFTAKKEMNIRKLAFVCGAVSVISWLSVCILGVLDSVKISYFEVMSIYFEILIFGIILALFIEKRELN